MKIVILLHGKRKVEAVGAFGAADVGQWIDTFNIASVDNIHPTETD
jgi:hypothetical protein